MPDPIPNQPKLIPRRGNPAMRRGGPSLNPAGRPSVGKSLAAAMRHKFPVEKIVAMAGELAESAESDQVRLSALQFIAERAHGKAVTVVEATVGAAGGPVRDWSAMPVGERRELLARLRAVPELTASGDAADE